MTPIRPSTIIPDEDRGGSFVAAVLKAGAKHLTKIDKEEDPQKALLKLHEATEATKATRDNFMFRAYSESQPVNLLDYSEPTEGDKRMSEKMSGEFCRKCGQKICRCVDYSIWGTSGESKPGANISKKP